MIFSCPRCSTRYKLADERVVNRLVKVRCTQCGVVIVVRDPALATDRGDVKPPSLPPQDLWFAAISGQQHGPVSLAGMKALIDRQAINTLSYVWKQGMPHWLRAGEVAELITLFPTDSTEAPTTDGSVPHSSGDDEAVTTQMDTGDEILTTSSAVVLDEGETSTEQESAEDQETATDREAPEELETATDREVAEEQEEGEETTTVEAADGEGDVSETSKSEDVSGDDAPSDEASLETEEPAAEEAAAEEAAAEEPAAEEAAAEEAIAEEAAAEEPIAEEAAAEEPIAEEAASEEAASEEAASEEPIAEEAASEEATSEEAASQEPATGEDLAASESAGDEEEESVSHQSPVDVGTEDEVTEPLEPPEESDPEDEPTEIDSEVEPRSDEPPPVPEPSEVTLDEEALSVDEPDTEEDAGDSDPDAETADHEAAPDPDAETADHEAAPDPDAETADHEAAPDPDAETVDHEAAPDPDAETVDHEAAPDPDVISSEESPEEGVDPDGGDGESEPSDGAVEDPEGSGAGLKDATEAVTGDWGESQALVDIDIEATEISGYEDTILATDGVILDHVVEPGSPDEDALPYAETLLATEQVIQETAEVADPAAETQLVTEQVVQDLREEGAPSEGPVDEAEDESSSDVPEGEPDEHEEETIVVETDGAEEADPGAETQLVPEQEVEGATDSGEPNTRETLEPDDLGKLVDAEHPDETGDHLEMELLPLPPDQEGLLAERRDVEEEPDDLFAAVDEGSAPRSPGTPPEEGDKGFFRRAMRGAPRLQSLTHIEAPSSAEMQEIRQEFSVVARLEQSKKKHQLVIFGILGLLAGLLVAGFFLFQEQSARQKAENEESFRSPTDNLPTVSREARYDSLVPEVQPEPEVPEAPKPPEPTTPEPVAAPAASTPQVVKPRAAAPKKKYKKLSAAQMALLQDDDDVATPSLKFNPGAEARKAAEKKAQDKAQERRKQMASERTEKVVETFARKRRQLARCKGEEEEKVKVKFTIAANGRVTDVKVTGAANPEKSKCIRGILERAIFPSGSETETFSMPVTL